MKIEDVKRALSAAGLKISSEQRLRNNTGNQLRLENGAVVNCFDKGTVNLQGKNKAVVEKALGGDASLSSPQAPSSKVFVVYGHDSGARDQLEAMLRRWDLDPI